jgi:hypothetical protein
MHRCGKRKFTTRGAAIRKKFKIPIHIIINKKTRFA